MFGIFTFFQSHHRVFG
jgi:inorganic pyrophosphatase